MSAIILEGSLAHYEALGRGRPLLFLHDWIGSWRYWVPTMVDISAQYRAYALDFWGFGDSDKMTARYHVPGYVTQVELFLDQMGIATVPLIGHGLGGVVALQFALRHPERVDQVMAVSMPLTGEHIARPLGTFSGGAVPARALLGRRLKDYEEVDIEAAKTDEGAVVASVRSAREQDVVGTLQNLDPPILLVHGQEDPLIQSPNPDLLAEFDYNVYSFTFEDSQHYPMLDEPSKFNRVLRDFLMYGDNWDKIEVKDEWKRRMR